jgi:hypothetical protein
MKPPILREVRKIIDMEYATPPIISGKCWEARATEQIVAYYEPLIQQAKAEVARIWDDVVCPMCYRLNPHHAHENRGEGCNWCSEKEDYTGQTLEQSLKSKWGKE